MSEAKRHGAWSAGRDRCWSAPVFQRLDSTRVRAAKVWAGRTGLTLLEVMLALAILGTGMLALMGATSRCLAAARRTRDFATVRDLLAQADAELPLVVELGLEEGVEEEIFEGHAGVFRWTRIVEDLGELDEVDRGLFRITTTLARGESGEGSREEMTTLLYAPTSGGRASP